MRKIFYLLTPIAVLIIIAAGCQNKPQTQMPADSISEEPAAPDSTVYGVCGENTSMHSLELITDAGDTLTYMFGENDDIAVVGGLLAGDRMAVVDGKPFDGEKTARKIINLTTLTGKWTSLDKNFEIQEGGVVVSTVEAEKNPWTNWKIFNGKLILNRDTFDIDGLGSDSLYLENNKGIFVYKRAK